MLQTMAVAAVLNLLVAALWFLLLTRLDVHRRHKASTLRLL
jgi:hypothetical protein